MRLRHLTGLVPIALIAAAPGHAATAPGSATASIVKPLTLSKVQDLNFGTLMLGTFTGTRTVTLSRANVLTCPTGLTCSGATSTARFNILGPDKLVALLTVSSPTLVNGANTIPFTANAPLFVILFGTGAPGVNFDIGGSVTISPTTAEGVYSGVMNVTADYF